MKYTLIEIVRYGDPLLGQHIYGIVDNLNRQDIIEMMRKYNCYRGGKYPVIVLTELIPNELNKFPNKESINLN